MLAGCSESQSPIGVPAAMPRIPTVATQSARSDSSSWIASDAPTRDLLYVSTCCYVSVYSYPQGEPKGKLKGFSIAAGECVDQKGNVFITDEGAARVFEYAHGGAKRIRTYSVGGGPEGCAVDPTTGNLAVATLGPGEYARVSVFKNARGNPMTYKDPAFQEYFFPGYDDKGNLLVQGMSQPGTGHTVFAELPKGGSKLKTITLNESIGWPGGVQWDGKYWAVGDQAAPVIRQFTIKGSQGMEVGTTAMGSGADDVTQSFIQGRTLIVPNVIRGMRADVLFYKYPAGGDATKKITRGLDAADGAAVSLAPHR